MKTLKQIIESEKKNRIEKGAFGIQECKEAIRFEIKHTNKSLYQLLEKYVKRANEDMFFNKQMVLACWEMINEQ